VVRDPTLDLAVIGNCQIAALVDKDGTIVWSCWPQPDAEPIFCALLRSDYSAATDGVFAVSLNAQRYADQRYERNTAVVETRLFDEQGGEALVTDFCPRFRIYGRLFRPAVLVRIIEPLNGRPQVRIRLRPSFNYGATPPSVTAGGHHLRFGGDGIAMRVTTDASLGALQGEYSFVLDRRITLLLGPDERVEEQIGRLAQDWLVATRDYWAEWVRTLAIPLEWQEAVIRAAITLKLCTYEDTGAVLAALTTSIPEAPDTGRTWDYRYCWLRDAFFVVQALNRLGATRTMEGFLRFIENIALQDSLETVRPVYRISGSEPVVERAASNLSGFRGMGPVRVGNQAFDQRQHDVYGSVIMAATQLFYDERLGARGDHALYRRLEALGAEAIRAYGQPDAGPWEFRTVKRAHSFSAAMCWAACDRLAHIGRRLGLAVDADRWRLHAEHMRDDLLRRAWNSSVGSFVDSLDGDGYIDATMLLLPELGVIPPGDERFAATVKAIERELVRGEYVLRYRHRDDFGDPESAFTICSFWYINALAMLGRHDEAIGRFEALLARRNHVGLLSEDIVPATGELWGNYPQTYSLVGIIRSAIRLSKPWEAAL